MDYVIHVTIAEGLLSDDSIEEAVDFLRSCIGPSQRIVIRPLSEVISC